MTVFMYSYDHQSESAKALADELDIKRIRHQNSTFKGNRLKTVINWGSSELPHEVRKCVVINSEGAVNAAVHKIQALRLMNGLQTVPFTTDHAVASLWVVQGSRVVVRTRETGADGAGVSIVNRVEDLVPAPLYTKFIPARNEYRVNVCLGRTMGVQKKVPLPGRVHNHDLKTTGGGYGFDLMSEQDVMREVNGIRPLARAAVGALGLDFGGVDIIHGNDGLYYILEVNTAPQLTPVIKDRFAARFREVLNFEEVDATNGPNG